jgi:predicted ATP-grasp superfamily ATP-dependent carboligase
MGKEVKMAAYIPLPIEVRHERLEPPVDVKINVDAVYEEAKKFDEIDKKFKEQMRKNKQVPQETMHQQIAI